MDTFIKALGSGGVKVLPMQNDRVMLSLKGVDDMGRRRGQRKGWLREEKGSWLLTYRLYPYGRKPHRETVTIGAAKYHIQKNERGQVVKKQLINRHGLTQKQAERLAWDNYLSKVDGLATKPKTTITVSEFWDKKYWPQAELRLKKSTRVQYGSLWRKWIKPRIGTLALGVVNLEEVEELLAGVKDSGVSPATVKSVRKVASAIITRARKLQYFSGENPAGLVQLPDSMAVRKPYALTHEQAWMVICSPMPDWYRDALKGALLTGMNAAELAGMWWGYVNLTDRLISFEGERVPAMHIAVRIHYYRGEYGTLKEPSRCRDIPITAPLQELLVRLKQRGRYTGPNDPVFCGRSGKPISEHNVQRRYLKPIGERLGLPYLGWHVLRHTFSTWMEQEGMVPFDRKSLMGHADMAMTDRYTHEDRERMRRGLESVVARLFGRGETVQ